MTQKELASKTMLPDRTVRLAMSHLLEKGYVKRKISIRDSRQKIYEITKLDWWTIKWSIFYTIFASIA